MLKLLAWKKGSQRTQIWKGKYTVDVLKYTLDSLYRHKKIRGTF